ncbi:MAG: sugar transferase [Heyndrickxia coagulans]|uniref:sugar transferase n=1 Tax=Heyndrickxia coagulans TaxID=1398 RepID=UPI0003FCA4BC|nr:sugar transferase [Heyndrickxia coagulans]
MKKYIFEILESEKEHAGSKAKSDISFFLHEEGFRRIFYDRDLGKLEKLLFAKVNFKNKLGSLDQKDILVVQYPIYMNNYFMDLLLKEIKSKSLTTILILHDIESLRVASNDINKFKKEINLINHFNIVISHNSKMTTWLQKYGLKSKVVNLGLFDYYHGKGLSSPNVNGKKVVFAGNLGKSGFLSNMSNQCSEILLFGPNPGEYKSDNIKYMGSFSPEDLPSHLIGNYGLVWDGDTTNACSGSYGNYMKYNNPHKTSLYLSCGIPVIIWKEAALASFIEKYNAGLTIKSLDDLDEVLKKVTNEQYEAMRNNAIKLSNKIRNGFFIKRAINEAQKLLLGD